MIAKSPCPHSSQSLSSLNVSAYSISQTCGKWKYIESVACSMKILCLSMAKISNSLQTQFIPWIGPTRDFYIYEAGHPCLTPLKMPRNIFEGGFRGLQWAGSSKQYTLPPSSVGSSLMISISCFPLTLNHLKTQVKHITGGRGVVASQDQCGIRLTSFKTFPR